MSNLFTPSIEHRHYGPRALPKADANEDILRQAVDAKKYGLFFDQPAMDKMLKHYETFQPYRAVAQHSANMGTFDSAIVNPQTTPSVAVPIQFLQTFLPGTVNIATKARNIDLLTGITQIGNFTDEQIVQGLLELSGNAQVHSDLSNVPLTNWNMNWNVRTVVRFEQGLEVGQFEEERAARMNTSAAASKRMAALLYLEIMRNATGFYGYNSGAGQTYGFLNDPGLPAYVNLPNGASGSPLWSQKTALEIIADVQAAAQSIRTSSGGLVDPNKDEMTLSVATSVASALDTPTQFGYSVHEYLTRTFKNLRVESAPELSAANGSANVFYLYAEKISQDDGSTDDGRTFVQMVPAKMKTGGVEQRVKSYVEAYFNATAGVMCKRPYVLVRRSGC